MKKIFSIILALFMLIYLASCGGDKADGSSTPVSSDTSSTASFEKPEKVEHDGNNPGDFGTYIDVTPEDISTQSSLDTYFCEAQWVDSDTLFVLYIRNVQTMPNYFERRFEVKIMGLDGTVVSSKYYNEAGSKKPLAYKAFDNGYVLAYEQRIAVYDLEHNEISSYSVSDPALLDVSDNGKVLYSSGSDAYLDGVKLSTTLGSVYTGALNCDGSKLALSDGSKGVYLNADGSKIAETELNVGENVTALVSDNGAVFSGAVKGGNADLKAVIVKNDASVSTVSYGELFANTYARGKIFEDNGKLYLVSSLTPGSFDFGNLTLATLDGELKPTDIISIDGGYFIHNRYDFSAENKLLITENVVDLTDIKDYIHFI